MSARAAFFLLLAACHPLPTSSQFGNVVSTFAGTGIAAFADGTGTAAAFNNPWGMASDGNGTIYVADKGNHRIRKIVVSTGVVTTFAGNGTAAFADGTGVAAKFNSPTGIAYSSTAAALYVTDTLNNRVRKSECAPLFFARM